MLRKHHPVIWDANPIITLCRQQSSHKKTKSPSMMMKNFSVSYKRSRQSRSVFIGSLSSRISHLFIKGYSQKLWIYQNKRLKECFLLVSYGTMKWPNSLWKPIISVWQKESSMKSWDKWNRKKSKRKRNYFWATDQPYS